MYVYLLCSFLLCVMSITMRFTHLCGVRVSVLCTPMFSVQVMLLCIHICGIIVYVHMCVFVICICEYNCVLMHVCDVNVCVCVTSVIVSKVCIFVIVFRCL